MKPKLLSALAAVTVALGAGCATTQPVEQPVMGAVALVPARHAPEQWLETHSERTARVADRSGRWTAEGAKLGAIAPIRAYGVGLIFPVLIPIGMVTGAVIGGVSGAVATAWHAKALPEKHAAPLRALVERSLDERLHAALASRVAQIADDLPRYRVVLQPEAGPKSSRDAPDYKPLASQFFDCVLELSVTHAGFIATDDDAPSARLLVGVRARVVPLGEGASPWQRDWEEWSEHHGIDAWQVEGGRLLGEELDKALAALARRIADGLLAST